MSHDQSHPTLNLLREARVVVKGTSEPFVLLPPQVAKPEPDQLFLIWPSTGYWRRLIPSTSALRTTDPFAESVTLNDFDLLIRAIRSEMQRRPLPRAGHYDPQAGSNLDRFHAENRPGTTVKKPDQTDR